MKCGWASYSLNDEGWNTVEEGGSPLEEFELNFTKYECENEAIREFAWSTERLREVYGAEKTPVCDEHLLDFKTSNEISELFDK